MPNTLNESTDCGASFAEDHRDSDSGYSGKEGHGKL